MSLEVAVYESVSDAFNKELKVWEDVYKRDGYIRDGGWLHIYVSLQAVVIDALISTKEFQELSEREKLFTALSLGVAIEEKFRSFQADVRKESEE